MIRKLTLFLSILAVAGQAMSDSRGAPWVMVKAANGGRFYLKMVPDRAPADVLPPENQMATVIVCKPERGRCDTEVWACRVPWSSVYLSGNGEYLAWIGHSGAHDHVLEFYHRDRLIKGYALSALLRGKAKYSAGGVIMWLGSHSTPRFVGQTLRFKVVTSEGIEFEFDATDGSIVSTGAIGKPSN